MHITRPSRVRSVRGYLNTKAVEFEQSKQLRDLYILQDNATIPSSARLSLHSFGKSIHSIMQPRINKIQFKPGYPRL